MFIQQALKASFLVVIVVPTALVLTVLACICIYLVNPNQGWLAQPLPSWPFLLAGLVLLAAGICLWMLALRPLAGIAVALHMMMVCLFACPYIAALRMARQEG